MSDNILSEIDKPSDPSITAKNAEDLKLFLSDLFGGSTARYATFSFTLDAIDPLAYLEMCWNDHSFRYYWEKPAEEFAIAAGEELLTISAAGSIRFEKINRQFEEIRESVAEYSEVPHPHSGMLFLGGFSFFDDIDSNSWQSFSPALFTVPKWMIIKDGKFTAATITVDLDSFNSPETLHRYLQDKLQKIMQTSSFKSTGNDSKSSRKKPVIPFSFNGSGYEKWASSVNKAKKLIRQQNFEKIVLARDITIERGLNIAPTQVLNKLRRQYHNCYNFLIHNASGKTFLGSTPERLGTFRNRLLLTEALAGSMQRGETATEDTFFEMHLSGSSKNRDEHNFVIKDIEERLQPFASELKREDKPEVKKLSNVQHLYTPIRVHLKDDTNLLEVISRLHPTPAVGGYPWKDAAPFIAELEDFDRGWYAGPVGWFNTKKDGEFAVAIRSGLFTKDKAHFFAGCGIVEDSNPAAEWKETNLKLKPMLSALQYD